MCSPGRKWGRAEASATRTAPSLRCDSHSARIGPPATNSAQSALDRGALVRRQELVDLPADQVALGDAEVLAAGGIDVDVAALVVGDEDRVERRVEDGAQLLLVLAQHGLGALAADRGSEQARRRPQRVELGRAPGALRHAVVEADEAPPVAVDEDRHRRDREDVLRVEDLALAVGEVAHLAGEELVALPDSGRGGASPTSSKHMSCISGLSSSAVTPSATHSKRWLATRLPSARMPHSNRYARLASAAIPSRSSRSSAASRQLGSATSRPAAWLTACRIASRRRRSRSTRSRLTPAATSPAAARSASVSAALQSRSRSQSSKPMKPHQRPRRRRVLRRPRARRSAPSPRARRSGSSRT